jgi:FtsZ-binding cell division protein ZapB
MACSAFVASMGGFTLYAARMYWRQIASRAWDRTTWRSADKGLSVLFGILRVLTDKRSMGWSGLESIAPQIIESSIIAYIVLCSGQFLWQYIKGIGHDQDSKQNQIRQLLKMAHPELSEKAQHAIQELEMRIQEVEALFNEPRPTEEEFKTWTNKSAAMLGRVLGQGSDWIERFTEGVKAETSQSTALEQTLLLRQVTVLRDVIDEIKRQRVLVLTI